MIVVQLIDANGLPSPARNGSVTVGLFSSDPGMANSAQQVTIPYGKSHAEAEFSAGIRGSATITAIANGYKSGSVIVTSSLFNGFALSVTPMSNPVSPGDDVKLKIELLASGIPYNSPVSVPVIISTSASGIGQQAVEVEGGSCCAYAVMTIPGTVDAARTPFVTVAVAASGFTSSQAAIRLSPKGGTPEVVLVGPVGAPLAAGSTQFLSVALFNQSLAPAVGSVTLSLFSSNASVILPQVSRVTINGSDGAFFAVHAITAGTAQVTAVAPGLSTVPLTITVVNPYKPKLKVFVPPVMREGERYSFATEFTDWSGATPWAYGPATIYVSSSSVSISPPSSLQVSELGYAIGTLTVMGSGNATITAALEGIAAGIAGTNAVIVSLVAPVTYTVTAASDAGPLLGVPLNFSFSGVNQTILTNRQGQAIIRAYNDSATLISAPPAFSVGNSTFYFTGWSNTARKTTVAVIGGGNYKIEAQYLRSIVPTTYTLLALGDGGKPIAGMRFNVTGGRGTLSLKTDSSGEAAFVLPNATSFRIAVLMLYQPSGGTKYNFLGLMNSTKDVANFTSSQGFTISAKYATFYSLEVATPIGQATGAGWYRSGSTASYSISETSSGGPLVYQRFASWTGSITSSQPSSSVLMDSPKSITAKWAEDNSMLFAAAGGAVTAAAILGFFIFRLRKKAAPS